MRYAGFYQCAKKTGRQLPIGKCAQSEGDRQARKRLQVTEQLDVIVLAFTRRGLNLPPMPNNPLDRTIFDAIPTPAFVVNGDVEIIDLNEAAARFCGHALNMVYKRRGGDVLGCLHATDVSEGCGKGPACQGCIIRTSVVLSLQGQAVSHRIVNLQLSHGLEVKELRALITSSPLKSKSDKLALLIVENIPDIPELKTVVPSCMRCKKIWDEEQYWTDVEEYFHKHAGVCFAHGLCPECAKAFSELQ